MWANDTLRQKQDFPPWPAGTIVTAEVPAAYNDWKQVADDYELPVDPEQLAAETQLALIAAVQNHLDLAAQAYGYDDIKSAVTYAEEPAVLKFQAEGKAFRAWRSLVWAACYAILDDVLAGTRTVPTVDELLAELPALDPEV